MKTTNTTHANPTKNPQDIVHTLLEVGGDWARQGIDIGITAVRTQAGLFDTLSKTLNRAADALATAAKPVTEPQHAAGEVVDTTVVEAETADAKPARKRTAKTAHA